MHEMENLKLVHQAKFGIKMRIFTVNLKDRIDD
jgi:hypothetical protein